MAPAWLMDHKSVLRISICCCCRLQIKLLRQADRSLELLDGDEAKYADEMTAQQEAFVGTINNLAAVSDRAELLPCGLTKNVAACMLRQHTTPAWAVDWSSPCNPGSTVKKQGSCSSTNAAHCVRMSYGLHAVPGSSTAAF
jgi:hypothetical protein